jgi:hypothetical protein
MNIQDIFPNIHSKKINQSKEYSYPTNFIVVNKKLFNQIYGHFQQGQALDKNQLSYDVLIFGECVIIKSRVKPNIIYVSILKEKCNNDTKYENEIRYIFEFNNEECMKNEIKFMQKNSFNHYINFKNISEANSVDYKEVRNNKEIIGYIIYNYAKKSFESAEVIKDNKVLKNNNNPISSQPTLIFNPCLKSILLGLNQFENFTKGLKEMIILNPQYKLASELSNYFDNFMNNKNISNKIESIFNSSIQTGNYEYIIYEILFKLVIELKMNKSQSNNNLNCHFGEMNA